MGWGRMSQKNWDDDTNTYVHRYRHVCFVVFICITCVWWCVLVRMCITCVLVVYVSVHHMCACCVCFCASHCVCVVLVLCTSQCVCCCPSIVYITVCLLLSSCCVYHSVFVVVLVLCASHTWRAPPRVPLQRTHHSVGFFSRQPPTD